MRFLKCLFLGCVLAIVPAALAQGTTQQTATVTLTLNVSAAPPVTITPSTLPNVVVGSTYNQAIVGSGGTGALTYSVSVGSLPSGLALNAATGAITGTANTVGTYPFTIKVVDSNPAAPQSASQAYTVIVIAKLVFTATTLPSGLVGSPYSANVPFSGGVAPYTCSATGLAPGLSVSVSGNNCVISGTPTTAGSTTISLQVNSAQ